MMCLGASKLGKKKNECDDLGRDHDDRDDAEDAVCHRAVEKVIE